MPELFLIVIAFFSSTFTAVIGLGGGLLLISLMPGFIPIAAVVPVHGVVQLASNVSRAGFAFRQIKWPIILPYAAGVILGAALGSRVVGRLPLDYMPVILGLFILVVTWVPLAKLALRVPGRFFPLGAVQSFLSLFVGATGPLSAPFLLDEKLERDQIVAVHATMIATIHLVKSLTFFWLGFLFNQYLTLMAGMIVSVTLGSYVGTRLRSRVPEKLFRRLFRIAITVLALRLVWRFAI